MASSFSLWSGPFVLRNSAVKTEVGLTATNLQNTTFELFKLRAERLLTGRLRRNSGGYLLCSWKAFLKLERLRTSWTTLVIAEWPLWGQVGPFMQQLNLLYI